MIHTQKADIQLHVRTYRMILQKRLRHSHASLYTSYLAERCVGIGTIHKLVGVNNSIENNHWHYQSIAGEHDDIQARTGGFHNSEKGLQTACT